MTTLNAVATGLIWAGIVVLLLNYPYSVVWRELDRLGLRKMTAAEWRSEDQVFWTAMAFWLAASVLYLLGWW